LNDGIISTQKSRDNVEGMVSKLKNLFARHVTGRKEEFREYTS
jgi:hypothetical protein